MTPLLPAPNPDPDPKEKKKNARGRDRKTKIPTSDEIQAKLLQLVGLVMMRLVSPSVANTAERILRTILDAQTRSAQEGPRGWQQEELAELCRRDPRVLPLLEPLLTDEQLKWLMGTVTDDADDQT
jgi:hypothetical protein